MFPSSSKIKLNAAGMSPEYSMLLPQREVESQEERSLLECLAEIYSPTSPSATEKVLQYFSPDVLYSSPKGEVLVGHAGISKLLALSHSSTSALGSRSVTHRLLTTPETLPVGSLVVDQCVVYESQQTSAMRNLLVLKRRAGDGLVCSMSEEEGHRKATSPLSARAPSASNFHSPTDAMLSPCTSKLNLAKRKHHQKAKPVSLFGPTAAAAAAAGSKQGNGARPNFPQQVGSLAAAGERMGMEH